LHGSNQKVWGSVLRFAERERKRRLLGLKIRK
jgi:hypothetical protein